MEQSPMANEVRPQDLPQYRCHKVVRAAKITAPDMQYNRLFLEGDRVVGELPGNFFEKHHPQAGGYLVVYADGYMSYSPAEAFEDGYTAM
jgi:hypothetical protein